MKKINPFFSFTFLIGCLEILALIVVTAPGLWSDNTYYSNRATASLGLIWICGMVYLRVKKGNLKKVFSRLLTIGSILAASGVLACGLIYLLALCHPYRGNFAIDTTLFDNKNVMIIVPHQDDDINLAGGLIEQYVEGGSDVTVVFTTNGDRYLPAETRAAEAVNVLTTLGVQKENIYYMGFGDQWVPQAHNGTEISHIYNSPEPDAVWTSLFGAAATYSTESIACYQQLPYTRSNYLLSIQNIIQEKMPDTIFAVDFDAHIDHKSADLFFEEAMCSILALNPDYHPTVYKGFAYGTAWHAEDDYYSSINLLSTTLPTEDVWSTSAFGYSWDARLRFPMSESNLNRVLLNNSVYRSLNQYRSQDAYTRATRILNGDKVFWERRTDSLLYGAEIFVGQAKTDLLNNFKLKEFEAISVPDSPNSGFVSLRGESVTVKLASPIVLNHIRLYDNPDTAANILAGYIDFSDGSRVEFPQLNQDGSGTSLFFPQKQVSWMEIVVTETDSETAGLSEIEAFCDVPEAQANTDTFLMALDCNGNFVYDYRLQETNSVALTISRFPSPTALRKEDLSFFYETSGKNASCRWDNDTLVVTCDQGSACIITVSDGVSSTTFTVSHPTALEYAYLQTLHTACKSSFNIRALYHIYKILIDTFTGR